MTPQKPEGSIELYLSLAQVIALRRFLSQDMDSESKSMRLLLHSILELLGGPTKLPTGDNWLAERNRLTVEANRVMDEYCLKEKLDG